MKKQIINTITIDVQNRNILFQYYDENDNLRNEDFDCAFNSSTPIRFSQIYEEVFLGIFNVHISTYIYEPRFSFMMG